MEVLSLGVSAHQFLVTRRDQLCNNAVVIASFFYILNKLHFFSDASPVRIAWTA